jgi:hypothetical protein
MDEPAEYLIVVDPHRGGGLAALGELVRHAVSDRLGVLTTDASTAARLRDRDGVSVVVDDEPPASIIAALDPAERLFVDAWVERRRPKPRSGDGAAWDTPGFEPPDP